ncbi:MAG: FkbM family methyltransferase [Sphingobium sp.]
MLPAYEAMLEAFYSVILNPGDMVIDVGAHNGRHSFPMAARVAGGGRVYSFEPLPVQYHQLAALVEERGVREISVFNFALGVENGTAIFTSVPDFPEYSGFKERGYHDGSIRRESINVEVRSLDALFPDNRDIRFIKIDVEGGELSVLRGGRDLIARSRPVVSFELGDSSLINYDYTSDDYFSYFEGLGYRIFSIFGLELDRDQFVEFSARQFLWDYVAIPHERSWPAGHAPIRVMIDQMGGIG